MTFSHFLGILCINSHSCLVLAEEVTLASSINNRDIFRVEKPKFLFYEQESKENLSEGEVELMLNLSEILKGGIYFSFCYNLSECISTSKDGGKPVFDWGVHLKEPLQHCNKMWLAPVIQGHIGRMEVHFHGLKVSFTLISRRANELAGTQLYSRGINSEGFTGNYVET